MGLNAVDRDDKDMWHFYDNTQPSSFCGRNDVILAGVRPGLEATVGTKDFIAGSSYILQYTVGVKLLLHISTTNHLRN